MTSPVFEGFFSGIQHSIFGDGFVRAFLSLPVIVFTVFVALSGRLRT